MPRRTSPSTTGGGSRVIDAFDRRSRRPASASTRPCRRSSGRCRRRRCACGPVTGASGTDVLVVGSCASNEPSRPQMPLDHHPASRHRSLARPSIVVERGLARRDSSAATATPLPAARPSAFSTADAGLRLWRCSPEFGTPRSRRSAHRGAHHLLRVGLEPFSAAAAARAEGADAASMSTSTRPGDERHLRTDDRQVDRRRAENPSTSSGSIDDRRVGLDAGVAGRAQHLGRLRRPVERPHQRVLTRAGPDDEDGSHSAPMKSSIGIASSDW